MDTLPIKALRLSPLDRGARFLRRMCYRLNIPTKSISLVWGLVVVEWAIGIYLVVNYLLPSRISADQFLYVYQPILWGSLALLAWMGWRFGLRDRPKPVFSISFTAILIALCQIAALAIAGLLLGFGHSPYDHELGAILRNLLYLGTVLVSLEMTRAYLVTRFKHRYPWISFILVSLLMTTLRIAPATFGRLDSLQSSIQIIGERLLPALTQSILATLLAMLGWSSGVNPLSGNPATIRMVIANPPQPWLVCHGIHRDGHPGVWDGHCLQSVHCRTRRG